MNPPPRHRLSHIGLAWLGLCAQHAFAAPQLVTVIMGGQPVPGAAVSVQVKGEPTMAPPGTQAQMGQRNKAFVPRLLIVQTGTAVQFPNFDQVRHHVYSFSAARTFEIKLYSGTPATPVVFDKPGTASLGCNIHDQMLAFIHVVDTARFGLTDTRGNVTIDVPPGEHRLRVWSPALGEGHPGVEQVLRPQGGAITVNVPQH